MRVLKVKKKCKLVYSNHYPLLLTLASLPRKQDQEQGEQEVRWNLAREGGWSRYKSLSEEGDKILEVVENKNIIVDEVKEKFDKTHNKMKFQAFGKVIIRNRNKRKHE